MADLDIMGSQYDQWWWSGAYGKNIWTFYKAGGTSVGEGVSLGAGGYIYGNATWTDSYAYHKTIPSSEFSKYDSVTIDFNKLVTTGSYGNGVKLEVRCNGSIVKAAWIVYNESVSNPIQSYTMDLTTIDIEDNKGYCVYIGVYGHRNPSSTTQAIITDVHYTLAIPDNPYDTWVADHGSSITGDIRTGQKAKASDIKNLRQAIFYEMSRRDNPINNYAGSIANQAPGDFSASAGGALNVDAAKKALNSLLIINDFDRLVEQNKDMNILYNGVTTNLIDRVKALGQIDKTSAQTGCRAACTGLCLGTCYTGCGNGCSGTSQVITINCTDCDRACSSNCGSGCSGGCTTSCAGSCGGTCASSCVGSCSGTCMNNCGAGCGNSCSNTCSGCSDHCWTGCSQYCAGSCTGGCYSGCSGTCANAAQKPTAPSTNSCSGCAFGCKSTCSTGCVNLTK